MAVYELRQKDGAKSMITVTDSADLSALIKEVKGYPPKFISSLSGIHLLHEGGTEDIADGLMYLFGSVSDFSAIAHRLLDRTGGSSITFSDTNHLHRLVETSLEKLDAAKKLITALEEMVDGEKRPDDDKQELNNFLKEEHEEQFARKKAHPAGKP